ncbi:hypothetical protein SVAN01_00276 [Stagonosporopsis vannaccii]|nr:hypothetical protein SVAN01_00276 [Stagonosporopsis vannaccii]
MIWWLQGRSKAFTCARTSNLGFIDALLLPGGGRFGEPRVKRYLQTFETRGVPGEWLGNTTMEHFHMADSGKSSQLPLLPFARISNSNDVGRISGVRVRLIVRAQGFRHRRDGRMSLDWADLRSIEALTALTHILHHLQTVLAVFPSKRHSIPPIIRAPIRQRDIFRRVRKAIPWLAHKARGDDECNFEWE